MFAAIPFDQQLTDTYFVVAHFHYVIFGAAVFPLLGGMYYWFPKVTGKMYYERWGQASFWLTFVGMNITFFPMHILGLDGMPRRDYTYSPGLGWSGLNLIETLGAYLLAVGLLMVAANLITSLFRGEPAGDDPFGGDTLEWSTSSPPPEYNYAVIPTVSSPYPNWDREDREADRAKLERGEQVLDHGHETAAITVVDGEWDEILEMPSSSPWPPLVALALAGVFTMILLGAVAGGRLLPRPRRPGARRLARQGAAGSMSPVTRSMEATAAGAAAAVERQRRSQPSGWWGAILLIASEAALFGCLIASYFYLRFDSTSWPPDGIEKPAVVLPLVFTAMLVATCAPVFLAVRAARAGEVRRAWWLLALATAVQATYLGLQIHLFVGDLDSFGPQVDAYASVYYALLGAPPRPRRGRARRSTSGSWPSCSAASPTTG